MAKVICKARHDASKVDWKSNSVEASDFGREGLLFSRIYDDAADQGFVLCNPRTGTEAVWVVVKTDWHPAEPDEVLGWHLEPTVETVRKHPQLKGRKLLVIND